MKEIGIMFKAELVRAILADRKWQTRRVIKPQPPAWVDRMNIWDSGKISFVGVGEHPNFGSTNIHPYKSPYRPGDVLYVKETWGVSMPYHHWKPRNIPQSAHIEYRATSGVAESFHAWKSAMFMPKRFSRIRRRVLSIRAERIQEISVDDAIAEGVEDCEGAWDWLPGPYYDGLGLGPKKFVTAFSHLWDSINAKPKPVYRKVDGRQTIVHYESYPWEDGTYEAEHRGLPHYIYGNPYVWVVEFERGGAKV